MGFSERMCSARLTKNRITARTMGQLLWPSDVAAERYVSEGVTGLISRLFAG